MKDGLPFLAKITTVLLILGFIFVQTDKQFLSFSPLEQGFLLDSFLNMFLGLWVCFKKKTPARALGMVANINHYNIWKF